MDTILITGGAGFIGSHTADALLARGYRVRVLDCLDPQIHGAGCQRPGYLHPAVELVVGDVRRRDTLTKALDEVDAVYHFAALTGVGQSMYDIHGYCDVNTSGTALLLDILANGKHRVKKIILSSSRAVYGEGAYLCTSCGPVSPPPRKREQLAHGAWEMSCPLCGRTVTATATGEDKSLMPASFYALTKKNQEELFRLFSATYGIPSVILRYFNVYGVRQALNNPYTGIGAIFTNRALAGRDVPLYEDGNASRDFVNVSDVVAANILALENPTAENGTFNVGSGQGVTVRELAEEVIATLKAPVATTLTGQFRVGDIRHCHADLSRSRTLLGYQPRVTLPQGVGELVQWARGESIEDRHDAAEEALRERNLI